MRGKSYANVGQLGQPRKSAGEKTWNFKQTQQKSRAEELVESFSATAPLHLQPPILSLHGCSLKNKNCGEKAHERYSFFCLSWEKASPKDSWGLQVAQESVAEVAGRFAALW